MSVSPSTLTEVMPARGARPEPSLPRLLNGIPETGAMSLREHLAVHGPAPVAHGGGRRRGRERAGMLIDELERSGLLGRGGAAFPVATKMRAVASSRRRAIVVVNGAEGEPGSLKDRTLMETLPHLVLDGAVLAAQATGADEILVGACESAPESLQSLARAIKEREREPACAGEPRLVLSAVPSHYVAGQESALVNHLGGGPAKPTFTQPMLFEQGLRRRPTLVNNVETLSHVALIARHGAPWFRQLGTPSQPGSALVTLSGPVAHPGVYEIEYGASLGSLIQAAGGATGRVRGVLMGGYAGSWIDGSRLGAIALSNEHLAPHGAAMGAGVILLLSDQACPVAETARLGRWLAGQSARQCGPCLHGLDALAGTLEQIAGGTARGRPAQRADQLARLAAGRGACRHPDGAVNVLMSAMETFSSDFADHARHGHCDACRLPPELPLPARWPHEESRRPAEGRR